MNKVYVVQHTDDCWETVFEGGVHRFLVNAAEELYQCEYRARIIEHKLETGSQVPDDEVEAAIEHVKLIQKAFQ